jgi:hypothetical protein
MEPMCHLVIRLQVLRALGACRTFTRGDNPVMQCIQLYTHIQICPYPCLELKGGTGMAGKYYPSAVPSCHSGYTCVLFSEHRPSATLLCSNLRPAPPPFGE